MALVCSESPFSHIPIIPRRDDMLNVTCKNNSDYRLLQVTTGWHVLKHKQSLNVRLNSQRLSEILYKLQHFRATLKAALGSGVKELCTSLSIQMLILHWSRCRSLIMRKSGNDQLVPLAPPKGTALDIAAIWWVYSYCFGEVPDKKPPGTSLWGGVLFLFQWEWLIFV